MHPTHSPSATTFATPPPTLKRPSPSTQLSPRSTKRHRHAAPHMSKSPTPPHKSFSPRPFHPYPISNSHFQTVVAHFYPPPPPVSYTRICLPSDDAQATLYVDIAFGSTLAPEAEAIEKKWTRVPSHSRKGHFEHLPESPPVAVVLHGLESNARSRVSRRIASALGAIGLKVIILNYRSCAEDEEIPTTLKLYHAGFTEDVETVLRAVKQAAIQSGRRPPPVFMCGFSLGANVACQFLGKWREQARTLYNVVAGAVACVPFDPTACQRELDNGWKGAVYSSRLVRTMQRKFRMAVDGGVDLGRCDIGEIERADRVGKIDSAYIAPMFGFRDKEDYYQKVDARKVLKYIKVPTLVINARDDPFFDHSSGLSLPTQEQIGDAPIVINITEHGGHCGFLDRETFEGKAPGYFQREFARFFDHVRESISRSDSSESTSPASEGSVHVNTHPNFKETS